MRSVHPPSRVDEYLSRGWWTNDTWLGAFGAQVRTRPDAEALIDPPNRAVVCAGEPQRLTWRQLAANVDRVANILRAAGIGPGDVVGVQIPNVVEAPISYLAIAAVGAVIAPLPVQYREHELAALGRAVDLRGFITTTRIGTRSTADQVESLRVAVPTVGPVFGWGPEPGSMIALGEADASLDSGAAPEWYDADVNELVTICFTSGTEGVAKAIPRSHGDWVSVAWTLIDAPRLTGADRMITSFPLASASGMGTVVSWLLTGCTMILHHPFDLEVLLGQVQAEQATFTKAAPATLTRLAQDEELLGRFDLSTLRAIGSGSAPLSEWMVSRFERDLGIEVINSFGSSEGLCLISDPTNAPSPARRTRFFPRFDAPGIDWRVRTAAYTETRLVDQQTGADITATGTVGELLIRGPMVFAGYLGRAPGDPRTFDEQGYYRTGDLFEIDSDDDRYYVHVDRAKDIVNRGGMKISSVEIEGLLQGHPMVIEVAAVGLPDAELGERLAVFVVPRPDTTPELADIVDYLRAARIASFKLPERLELLTELPRNSVGKVVKQELRTRAAG